MYKIADGSSKTLLNISFKNKLTNPSKVNKKLALENKKPLITRKEN